MKKTYKQKIKELQNVIDIQGQNGNWNYDPYMHGLYNGLIMAESIFQETEPVFREAPHGWLHPTKKWYQFWR